jgi:hypothetical protein
VYIAQPSAIVLPPGLTLNGFTGVLSGIPTRAGTFAGQVLANNGVPPNAVQSFSIFIAPNQTINFPAIANRTLGSAPFALVATASSGLNVGFYSSTTSVCTAAYGVATLVAPGVCTIWAVQAGNANFSNALDVPQSFTVSASGVQTQTITFPPLAPLPLGSAPISLDATASSGLPVSFASLTSGVCTVSGSIATLVAMGTCTVRASQSGNISYAAAPNVDQSFTVTAPLAAQNIAFAPLPDRASGSAPFTLIATASSGLPVSFASLTLSNCTVAGSTATLVAAGTCTVRASQPGNATYAAAANVDRSFQVTTPAPQTITFVSPADHPYHAQPFVMSASASSGLPVSFATLTPSTCAVSGTTVTVLTVGTCTIRASQAGNASFAPAPSVDRGFNVMRAAQSIEFQRISISALSNPPFEIYATASSGLAVAFASMTPNTCKLNDQWLSFQSIGTCTVRASQAGDGNYLAAPVVDQSLAIGVANQTLLFTQPSTQSMLHPRFVPSASASSGLPVAFSSLTPAICTSDGTIVTLIATGTCTIRATQAGNEAYAAVSGERSFTVLGPGSAVVANAIAPGPMIAYSTLLGGFGATPSARDTAFDVAVAPDGSAIVGGSIAGSYFPGVDASLVSNGGLDFMFVARLNPDRGAVDSVTAIGARSASMTGSGAMPYVGTARTDMAEALAMDSEGNAFVAAYSGARNYPVSGGTYRRTGPKAVFRISPAGSITMLPAVLHPSIQSIRALAIDSAGAIYLTGVAGAGMSTTENAAVTSAMAPSGGPYLLKLAPGGIGVVYATYLTVAGSRPSVTSSGQAPLDIQTTAYALTVDDAGNAYVAGQANAGDFPATPGAPDTTDNQNRDAFVAKINPSGSALSWVARLGGSDAERATSIALAPDGGVVIGGKTATRPFIGSNAFQPQVPFQQLDPFCYCTESGFVAKLVADGSRWIFVAALGTYGGTLVRYFTDDGPLPIKVAVDGSGAIYAAGYTSSDRQLPLGYRRAGDIGFTALQSPGRYDDGSAAATYGQEAAVRGSGGFLLKMSGDGRELFYSVLVNSGPVTALKIDGFGAAYVAGVNASAPQIAAAQAAPGSVFVAKVLSQPLPIVMTIAPSPSEAGASVQLTASVADARYAGTIEFRDGDQPIGSASTNNGSATLSAAPLVGVHRYTATLVGAGPWVGARSPEVIHAVTQAGTSP